MFSLSLIITVTGLVTFDLTVQEIKKLLGSRNEGFSFNMIQGLDQHIENRMLALQDLTKSNLIHASLINSNQEFKKIQDIKTYLNIKEKEIEFTGATTFIGNVSDENLTDELVDTIEFYQNEYDYDVIEELFVTNAYGANVVLASGTSDYSHSDEEWWITAKDTGRHVGDIQFNENYDSYSVDFAFSVNDFDGNFIGVLRVLVTLNDLLNDFSEEANVLTIEGRNILLLDKDGHVIFSNGKIFVEDKPISYFPKILEGKDVGYFELEDIVDDLNIVSYSKSTGYRTFEGFDWIAVVEQNSSSIVSEFVELRNSVLTVSILGMIASIIAGMVISATISTPLERLTKIANSISKGNFDVKVRKSRIDEINVISNSMIHLSKNLRQLIETEKQLAEINVKIKDERLHAIGELASSMAHDMKNPLATITSSAEILKKNSLQTADTLEVVNRMNRAISRMSHQIDDVLNYVRITPLDLTTVRVSELINNTKDSLEIPLGISISVQDSDATIKCDIEKMEIVFINIILNSIQAIGKEKGSIDCKIETKDSSVIIEIQNSGPKIPDDIFSKIFEPLITSKQKGTGLGLSSCKNIIEQHKGTIIAHNNPTRFIITMST